VDRRPDLLALLDEREPACTTDVAWRNGTINLRLTSFVGVADLPDDLLVSVRVIVRVGDQVVVCTNADGTSHAWPGGRREPGETHGETACREILEETGWILDAASIEPLGFLHLYNLGEPFEQYPFPDAVHLVVAARAVERAADDWTDTEGFEVSSRLVDLDAVCDELRAEEPMCIPVPRGAACPSLKDDKFSSY
jgi:8-oxo-dGTP pyrophosphatase MutT (NUDIX family)